MNKQEILKIYRNEDDKLLVAKMLDKIELSKKRNKISYTDFLDTRQKLLLQKVLNRIKENKYINYGGFNEAERTSYIFYPERFEKEIIEKNYSNIMQIIEIILPNELKGEYTHRNYLGALMRLGIKREKIGDIIVWEDGAHIIALKEIVPFILNNISTLTRFQKAIVKPKSIEEIYKVIIKKEEIEIIVASMRLDNIVSELARVSRAKAQELISKERVLINHEIVTKDSKMVNIEDKITIRGKGRFEIIEIITNTKKGRVLLKVEKYI